jgi:hypothetical protein
MIFSLSGFLYTANSISFLAVYIRIKEDNGVV